MTVPSFGRIAYPCHKETTEGARMSEIGFTITPSRELTADELASLRRHYLTYARAERDEVRDLHADLDAIYDGIDALVRTGGLARTITTLNQCGKVVVFSTDSSTLSLREFQQAMLAVDKPITLVAESAPDAGTVADLCPDDVLIVVTTSNGFARRQREAIEQSKAFKIIVTASKDPDLHAIFDEVLTIGEGSEEGSSLHRVYATFGVTYFFDRLFSQYARAYDREG